LKEFAEYLWVTSFSRLVGRLIMLIAPKGHFLTQIPQPMHRVSEIKAILEVGSTSIQSLPVLTTGHDFLHSCLHFYKKLVSRHDLRVDKITSTYLGLTLILRDDSNSVKKLANKEGI
jgi:trans-aconitate methyltransferase